MRPCPRSEVRNLAEALDVGDATAAVLVRRGYGDPETARAFLAAELPGHDPFLLGDVEQACSLIRSTIAAGGRICVHGDYDVDGICATALAVSALRGLGADVGWHLPSRFEEGYGVSRDTLARLTEEGCALVLTVDCGITAVEEVAEARAAGLEVIVTDHHRPGETLPACPVVATRPSDYPFPGSCGTGVVFKLLEALGAEGLDRHVDLVALATVADVVPLLDENRARSSLPACDDWGERTSPACGRSCASAASTRPRSTPARSLSDSRRGSTRLDGSGTPEAASSSCSPRTRARPAGWLRNSRG